MARDVTTSCLDYLMTFDFRNGMLRRRYDGVKYALKTCETVLYELSVTGLDVAEEKKDMGDDEKGEDGEPKLKRLKTDDASNNDTQMDDATATTTATTTTTTTQPSIIPAKELEELRKRMERRDELREKCIKRCRDAQKSAKQAIFALHRKDVKRALHLLKQCETIVTNDLNPLVEEDPTLHYGSYANVLEEYAEAKLFHVWLMGMQDGNGDGNSGSDDKPSGHLLTPIDFTTIPLEPAEYLGGLCDLTGEVGRYAVQQGTKRDSDGVQFCLETNLSILFSLETLQRFPNGSYVHKKMDQLRRSVQKLERMLYELSLVKATGRSIVVDSVNNDERKDKDTVKGDD
jgi:predicted translin family RNA/ssDNA-binding protein